MLKATSAIAGAKLVTIFISILRTKALAIFLGPGGMGAISLVVSSVELTRVLFAFGLDSATVRKVAEVSTAEDPALLDQAYRIASRTALLIGVAACVALLIASPFLSAKLLGTPKNFWWFALAGCSLIVTPLLGTELAFLQGLKKSRDLASCQIIASIAGAILNIAMVAWLGKIGGIATLFPIAIISVVVHHHFLKKYRPKIETPRPYNQIRESTKLLKLGSGFAINGIWLVTSGWLNLFFIKTYYGHDLGILQVGLYGAAATLANFYIGILVTAMGTEFYPSLIQLAHDRAAMNRLVNQQTLLSIGIGVPASLGMIIFSPWILSLLYSHEFVAGGDLMRWMLAGMAIRFAACPLGFTLLAVGSPRLIALSELATGAVMISTSYLMLQCFGLTGVGMALVLTNSLYLVGVFIVLQRMGRGWNLRTALFVTETFGVVAICLCLVIKIPGLNGILLSSVLAVGYFIHLALLVRKESGIGPKQLFQKIENLIRRK